MASNYNHNNYNPYNGNIYMQEMQNMKDRIDRQMQQYQQSQNQITQQQQQQQQPQPQIQQTFQLAPNQSDNSGLDAKMVQNVDEVKSFLVLRPTLFVNNEYSELWIKDINGNIRNFTLEEIIPIDESAEEINNLKQELSDIKALLLQQAEMQRQLPENPQSIEEPKQTKKTTKK